MKYLFVGDIHNHYYMFNDIDRLDKEHNFDRIIFMGDYVDDWNTTNQESLKTLDKIFSLKEEDPDKYTFLIGNHELSYLGYKCSGHKYDSEDIMEIKLKDNINKLDFYTSINCNDKEYICTHAGINNLYIQDILEGKNKWKETLEKINSDKLKNLYLLTLCSYVRGGSAPFSSFIWIDRKEHRYYNLFEDPIIPYQIVGHTPVKTIVKENGIYFIDTHSTYKDGSEYGDKSYLIWNEDKFEIIK